MPSAAAAKEGGDSNKASDLEGAYYTDYSGYFDDRDATTKQLARFEVRASAKR